MIVASGTVVPRAFCLPVPDAVDDLVAAALPNPAMSWLALVWRVKLEPGRVVLLGVEGCPGQPTLADRDWACPPPAGRYQLDGGGWRPGQPPAG